MGEEAEGIEAVWLRRAGMRSDLTVAVGTALFAVHKFPLYARTCVCLHIQLLDSSHLIHL